MDCPLKAGERTEAYRQANEALIAYGAGTFPSVDKIGFRAHLEDCAECKRAARSQRETWSALDAWTPSAVPSNFDERLFAKIDAYEQQSWWGRILEDFSGKWSWKPAMPVAVACTALVAAFLLNTPNAQHLRPTSVQTSIDTRVDLQQVERALDDLEMLKQLGVASTRPAVSKPVRSSSL